MVRTYLLQLGMPFWADPHNSLERTLQLSGDQWQGRQAMHHLMPGFPRDQPTESPRPRTMPPIPTDVPIPQPMDVPVPDPQDVPPPDPGRVPHPAKPRPDEIKPKPRSVP
jgi:hypothetical protein